MVIVDCCLVGEDSSRMRCRKGERRRWEDRSRRFSGASTNCAPIIRVIISWHSWWFRGSEESCVLGGSVTSRSEGTSGMPELVGYGRRCDLLGCSRRLRGPRHAAKIHAEFHCLQGALLRGCFFGDFCQLCFTYHAWLKAPFEHHKQEHS